MKRHNTQNSSKIRIAAKALGMAGLLLASVGSGFADPAPKAVEPQAEPMVWVDDANAYGSFEAERVREDLLDYAFAEAVRSEKWFGKYDFQYNGAARKAGQAGIELKVLNWRRSPAGMFEFSVSANYWNAEGEKQSLGTFHGLRTSITVFNGRDVGEMYADSAQDAFRDALRKLKKETVAS